MDTGRQRLQRRENSGTQVAPEEEEGESGFQGPQGQTTDPQGSNRTPPRIHQDTAGEKGHLHSQGPGDDGGKAVEKAEEEVILVLWRPFKPKDEGLRDFISVLVALATALLIGWGVVDVWQWESTPILELRDSTWIVRSEFAAGWIAIGIGITILAAWIVFILWEKYDRGEV